MKTHTLHRLLLACVLSASAYAQGVASKQVDVFGEKIHYLEAGTGPDVILLHGLGGDAGNWQSTIPALAAKYHVLAPDQIGFGESDKPLMNYRVATLVDFLNAFCRKLKVTKATFIGNSLGGWTAMQFALTHPEKAERLVLSDSAGYSQKRTGGQPLTRELLIGLNPSTLEGTRYLMHTVFYNQKFATDGVVEMAFQQHLHKGDSPTINSFIESILRGEDMVDGKLGAIKVPTLIIWGRQDALIPLAAGNALAEDIAGSKEVVLDSCGHVPQVECAAGFNAAVLKFLGE